MIVPCFKCGNGYESIDPNDFYTDEVNGKLETIPTGDGRCPGCKELARMIALKVDIDMANIRRMRGTQEPTPLQRLQEAIRSGKPGLNVKDLGLRSLQQ